MAAEMIGEERGVGTFMVTASFIPNHPPDSSVGKSVNSDE
jgi:hypothetical protein